MLLRRSISALLCFLWLLPSAVALRGPQLPECCLRQGEHHCDAGGDGATIGDVEDDGPVIHATVSCEYKHAPTTISYRADALPVSHSFDPLYSRRRHVPHAVAVAEQTAFALTSARAPPALN